MVDFIFSFLAAFVIFVAMILGTALIGAAVHDFSECLGSSISPRACFIIGTVLVTVLFVCFSPSV